MKTFVRHAVKTLLILLAGFSLTLGVSARAQAPAAPAAPLLTPDQLDQLLGPIALYPDALIALILPASTVPQDIATAAAYVSGNGDPAQIPNQPWDDSVKGLARYPDLLQWLNQNLDWATQLGDAFLSQPADVMDAIQQLRAQAKAAGTLVDTPQQQVVMDDGDIDIDPTNPDSIYVPQYDPDDVYDDGYDGSDGPLITFGPAFPVGAWLNYGMDWRRRGLYRGEWRAGRDPHGRGGNGHIANASPWVPDPGRVQHARTASRGAQVSSLARPKPMPGVTIPHRTGALHTGSLATPGVRTGNLSNAPRRDFTGWAGGRPPAPAVQNKPPVPAEALHAPAVVPRAPAQVPHAPVAAPNPLNDYRRGADARAASNRGQFSRQIQVAPQAVRPPPPAAIVRPPAPVAPVRPPPMVRPPAPAPRPAPPAPRPPPPPPSAFHPAPGAAAASARGAASRRLP